MGSERAAALADGFAAANAEAIGFARRCSPDDWKTEVSGENWPVGVVLHHVAESHEQSLRWLQAMSQGEAVTITAEEIDRANAAHAARAAAVGSAETIALLEEHGSRLEGFLRGLSDEELDRTAAFGPAGGRVFPTVDLAPVAAGHTREHVAHAQAAVRPG